MVFLDVCRVYLDTRCAGRSVHQTTAYARPALVLGSSRGQSQRQRLGACTLWAIVTFVRTEPGAADFLRWCQAYKVLHLHCDPDELGREADEAGRGRASLGRRMHGFERKVVRALQQLFYNCAPCLPSANDLAAV
ncbi:unnamed protein product [Trichogramma brassicae]|uniref:Uncharacterized protein n=1 Tax=Trichogramma brassicae TaxID=86971 RepID=A0A6H5IA48_9HYME|nr:unnamed protein product [Trichogramma brassicae]